MGICTLQKYSPYFLVTHAHHDGNNNASKNKLKTSVTMVEVAPLRTNK
jgi:hypothetical protein